MARTVDIRRNLNVDLKQIESFVHLSLIFGMAKTDPNDEETILTSCKINAPFSPADDDLKFVDEDVSERFFQAFVDQVRQETALR
ncbi:unnamed protein product [Onchocerca flexuosa]|nr:unnamed protein product [Onchocerca flexuosa]